MSTPSTSPTKVTLTNVRLSFPALFKPRAFSDGGEEKFQATFLIDKKNTAVIKAVQAAMEAAKKDKWGEKAPKGIKLGLRDGKEKAEVEGYGDDIYFVTARNSKFAPVVDGNITPLSEQSGKVYAGCYVNAYVNAWAQDNQYGKRINFNLLAVQFVRDGDAFGEGSVDVDQVFQRVEDSDESADGLL